MITRARRTDRRLLAVGEAIAIAAVVAYLVGWAVVVATAATLIAHALR